MLQHRPAAKMLVSDIVVQDRPWYEDENPTDVVIDGECYDTIIVEGWEPDFCSFDEDHGEVEEHRTDWSGEDGELLAEICVEPSAVVEETPPPCDPCDDCTDLSWLMNFKVGGIVNADESKKNNQTKTNKRKDLTPSPTPAVSRADSSSGSDTKPPFTYTKLIELALKENGQLTVSGIYKWISERYPFFKPNDDRWKNSVRHNLSINPHFRKGAKASRGSGHLWTVATPSLDFDRVIDSHKRIKFEPTLEQEVAAAAASILQQHPSEFLNPVSVEQVAAECGLLDGPLSFNF